MLALAAPSAGPTQLSESGLKRLTINATAITPKKLAAAHPHFPK